MARARIEHTIEPRGLRLPDAAAYVGMGETKFLQLVDAGRMPSARKIDGMTLWDRRALDRRLDEIFDDRAESDPYQEVA